jgi:NADH dehydrogenase [ubiquinone] 1 alpha subcomplex assembly factor 7
VTEQTPLERALRGLIESEGPIPVSRYMALCLAHPQLGYYVTRDPLGAAGDFVTAPEISQMFGELVGLWAVATWQAMGEPSHVQLVELGPGRGTLMADALRAARVVPAFLSAARVHLVEASPVLRERQRERLADSRATVAWHRDPTELPDAPLIVLVNEFFDALPIDQAVKTEKGWRPRVVGLDAEGRLTFGLSPDPIAHFDRVLPSRLRDAPPGAVFEWREDHVLRELCRRIVAHGGAALVIDYGHAESGFGDTLQAVRRHGYADPLHEPGETDLTAHVDFAAMRLSAGRYGACPLGPMPQGEFLRRMGIEARAVRLKARATEAQAAAIDAALARLIGSGPDEMGELFKVLAVAHPALAGLPGFDN